MRDLLPEDYDIVPFVENKYMYLGPKENDEDFHDLAYYMVDYFTRSQAISFLSFFAKFRIHPDQFYDVWMPKSPLLIHTVGISKALIGARRDKFLVDHKIDTAFYLKTQHYYDGFLKKESNEQKKFDASLLPKQQEIQQSKSVIIIRDEALTQLDVRKQLLGDIDD